MARYDYKCPKCESVVEVTKPMNDSDRVEHCEKCDEKPAMDKVFPTNTSFSLKGSGWSKDGYR